MYIHLGVNISTPVSDKDGYVTCVACHGPIHMDIFSLLDIQHLKHGLEVVANRKVHNIGLCNQLQST